MNLKRRFRDVELVVITGLSGAGRSEAAKELEDLGWFVIDNLPPALIKKFLTLALADGSDIKRVALVIDARGGTFFGEATQELQRLRRDMANYRMVFLEASDDVLVRRFEATRRPHPLASDERVISGIRRERALMQSFREGADVIIDTSDLSTRELRTRIASYFEREGDIEGLKTTVISFGYRFGLPLDSDLVLDVRFLPNPHWVDDLRPLTGLEDPVRDYVLEREETQQFMERAKDLFAVLLPGYQTEGRHYLTLAVGCTGGRHRSVVLAEELAHFMNEKGFAARVIHRDVRRPPEEP